MHAYTNIITHIQTCPWLIAMWFISTCCPGILYEIHILTHTYVNTYIHTYKKYCIPVPVMWYVVYVRVASCWLSYHALMSSTHTYIHVLYPCVIPVLLAVMLLTSSLHIYIHVLYPCV